VASTATLHHHRTRVFYSLANKVPCVPSSLCCIHHESTRVKMLCGPVRGFEHCVHVSSTMMRAAILLDIPVRRCRLTLA